MVPKEIWNKSLNLLSLKVFPIIVQQFFYLESYFFYHQTVFLRLYFNVKFLVKVEVNYHPAFECLDSENVICQFIIIFYLNEISYIN